MTEYLFERKPKKPVNRSERLRNKPWRVYYDDQARKRVVTFHQSKFSAVCMAFYIVYIARGAVNAQLIDVYKERRNQ